MLGAPMERGRRHRMLQVCAADYTAFYLLRPLFRAARDRGWMVEFACAEGQYTAAMRREGFGFRQIPMTRSAAPHRHARAILALAASLGRDRPDVVHTHTPAGGVI